MPSSPCLKPPGSSRRYLALIAIAWIASSEPSSRAIVTPSSFAPPCADKSDRLDSSNPQPTSGLRARLRARPIANRAVSGRFQRSRGRSQQPTQTRQIPPQTALQRRGRDSNSRYANKTHNGFRDRRIQPLCHPSWAQTTPSLVDPRAVENGRPASCRSVPTPPRSSPSRRIGYERET